MAEYILVYSNLASNDQKTFLQSGIYSTHTSYFSRTLPDTPLTKYTAKKLRWLDSNTNSMDMNSSKCWEIMQNGEPGVLPSIGSQRVEHDLANEQQNYTEKDHSTPSLPQLLSRAPRHTHTRFPQFALKNFYPNYKFRNTNT